MAKNPYALFFSLAVLCTVSVREPSDELAVSPESLVAEARKAEELWTAGTPPLVMRAEIQVLNGQGKLTAGQYLVNWVSLARWTEELRFSDYARLRVHDTGGYWQQATSEFQPEVIFELDTLLDLETVLRTTDKEVLGKIKNRSKDGVRQRCIDVKSNIGTARTLCFDEGGGNLLSVDYPQLENQHPPNISRIEYTAFDKAGQKRVPFEVRAFKGRTSVITVKVLEMTPLTKESDSLFHAPANSERWAWCDGMRPPELVNRVSPNYPMQARQNREQGRVVFYAVIEADGTLSRLTLIQRATPALESAAREAIRQWHYKPAACGPTPIRLETSIPVDFSLQQ